MRLGGKTSCAKIQSKTLFDNWFDALLQKTDHVIRVVNMTIAVIATFRKVGSPFQELYGAKVLPRWSSARPSRLA